MLRGAQQGTIASGMDFGDYATGMILLIGLIGLVLLLIEDE